jgi:hypothetical protein
MKALDASIEGFFKPLVLQMSGHHFPALDEEFKTQDDVSHSW